MIIQCSILLVKYAFVSCVNCVHISGFLGLCPDPHRASNPEPCLRTSVPQTRGLGTEETPYIQSLTMPLSTKKQQRKSVLI